MGANIFKPEIVLFTNPNCQPCDQLKTMINQVYNAIGAKVVITEILTKDLGAFGFEPEFNYAFRLLNRPPAVPLMMWTWKSNEGDRFFRAKVQDLLLGVPTPEQLRQFLTLHKVV